MTMAAAIEGTAQADSWSRPHRVAAVDIISDMSRAEAVWRDLEAGRASQTPYQRFDFLSAWQRQVGEREELSPFIVVAWDGERKPLALLPLARGRKHGVRSQVSWAASMPISTWRCGTATLPRRQRAPISKRWSPRSRKAADADLLALLSATARLARPAQSDVAVAASALGQ